MLIVWKSASSIPPHRREGRIWEAFRQWLETRDFLKSKRQNKIRAHTLSRWVFVLAASSRSLPTDWQPTENKSDQSLASSDPLWPTHRKPVGVTACVCVRLFLFLEALLFLPSVPNVLMVKDVPLTGTSQAGFHV